MRKKDRAFLWGAIAVLVLVGVLLGFGPNFKFRESGITSIKNTRVVDVPTTKSTLVFEPGEYVYLVSDIIMYRVRGSNFTDLGSRYELCNYYDSTDGGATWVPHYQPKVVRADKFSLEVVDDV